LKPDIAALAVKYGFPMSKPVELVQTASPASATLAIAPGPADALVRPAAGREWFVKTAGPAVPAAANAPVAAGPAETMEGRSRFNNVCSHCHGTNAVTAVSERDLRRLKLRYKDLWRETAIKTIKEGRSDLGMPSWKSAYDDKQIDELLGYLSTVQK
jgi:mono/diheme cytochrome c family protein